MSTYKVEKPVFRWIHCLECGARVELYYTMFFIDEGGLNRYGAICKLCRKKVQKRKNIIIRDCIVSANGISKSLAKALKDSSMGS